MDRLLHLFREHPAVAGIGLFAFVSLALAVLFGTLLCRAGSSLKPLVFVFGFIGLVALPQAAVHLVDALASHRSPTSPGLPAPSPPSPVPAPDAASPTPGAGPETVPAPVPWERVFGPDADPDLITDARRGLDAILGSATEAKLSFNAAGESALAARFPSASEARATLDRYGAFFQFHQATGSDEDGWTARRHAGQGEWNHVVTAGRELYAWTGPTRDAVERRRVLALGPRTARGSRDFITPTAAGGKGPDRPPTRASSRLARNTPVMLAFLGINLALAIVWFFRGSAWAARVAPAPGVPALEAAALRDRLTALNRADVPVEVTTRADGRTLEVTWRHADARWFDLMRVHRLRRTHKLVIALDETAHQARVREYWSAFDASAGRERLRFDWHAATGMQFFQLEYRRNLGVPIDANGRPAGGPGPASTFNLQSLKTPLLEAVTGAGWTWQPVMLDAPPILRWLTG